jgi:hypothetical protein
VTLGSLSSTQDVRSPLRQRGRYAPPEMISAVIACADETNDFPERRVYRRWRADSLKRSPERRLPSEGALRRQFGDWDAVVEAAGLWKVTFRHEAWAAEALAELPPIEANDFALEFGDHNIHVFDLHPSYEYRLWGRPDRELRFLSVTARVVNKRTGEIREQQIWVCNLAKASDDELKKALLKGMERMAKTVRRRLETWEADRLTPQYVMSVNPIDTQMRRLAERSAATSAQAR